MKKRIRIFGCFIIVLMFLFSNCLKKNNAPDIPATPNGPSSGYLDSIYTFSTITTDPNDDGISYRFDWGDGDTSDWSTWLLSGTPYSLEHTWIHSGSFFIKLQAKDKNEEKSNWSQSHNISIIAPFWIETFGGTSNDYSLSVQQTSDGGYIIGGITHSYGTGDGAVYLIKTDVDGNQTWAKTIDGTGDCQYQSVQQTTDGGYIIVGPRLIKTDPSGDTVWTKPYSGSGQQTSDGGYIIVHSTYGAGTDIYLIKTDANGNQVWTKTIGGIDDDEGNSVQQTTDGGYIIVGWTESYGSGGDIYLVKTDANGDSVWTKNFGGTYFDYGNSVQQTSDGGYVIAGVKGASRDVYLIRTDANGNQIWTKTFGGGDEDYGYSVQQTFDGGYIVTGSTSSFGAGNSDVYLIKTDANGNQVWTKTFGGASYESSKSVKQTTDGGYIIAGQTKSFGAGNWDVYIIKTDTNGNAK